MQPESAELIEQQGPLVTAVIVAHNQREALVRCLTALEASTARARLEIIVVDSGSGDGSGRVDEEFEGITVLRLPRDFGKTRARNIGTRTGKADLLLFIDPRVELAPEAVERMAAALEADETLAAVVPELRTPAGEAAPCGRKLPDAGTLKAASLDGTDLEPDSGHEAIADWAFLLRRPALKGMNGFDEKRFSEFWAELEVCWQIRNAGKRIAQAEGASALLHPLDGEERDETVLAADRVSGASSYIGKHDGFVAGLLFKLGCAFSALFSGRVGLFMAILSGNRVDPT